MEAEYRKVKKKSSLLKKLERYLSMSKAKPEAGCFSVYVGPEKRRFVIKAEFANHPLFRMLLEDAESEYGFRSEGPLLLPCDVRFFCKVLAEMDSGDDCDDRPRGFGYGPCSPFRSGYGLLTPPRLLKINHF